MPVADPLPQAGVGARAELPVVGAIFFLSGASALVYQVAWQRILALHSGVGIYSVAMIVAAFMAGLGAGSHLGGTLSSRLGRAAALRAFAVVELGVGLFGATSCWLYYDILYVRLGWLYGSPWSAGVMHFLALLLPTTLMGMSLPLLVRGMVRGGETAGRTIGVLYGINVLGAGAGAFVTPWLLMRYLGIDGAVFVAAAVNGIVGLGGLAAVRWIRSGRDDSETPAASPADAAAAAVASPGGPSFATWLALYATSGFCALSLEILWFRVVDVAVRSTAFTFGTVLGIYLVGMGAGCLAAARADRAARPLRVFLLCQTVILAYSALALMALAWLPTGTPLYAWFFDYWGQSRRHMLGFGIATDALLKLYVLLPLLLYGLPTMLMGYSFPVLQKAVQHDAASSGRKVGILQAGNIAGCTAGSLLVGIGLLDWVGTTGSVRVLLLVGAAMMLVGVRVYGFRSRSGASAAFLIVLAGAMPSQQRFWGRMHGVTDSGGVLIAEDPAGVSALVASGAEWRVHVNGKHHSWLPFGGVHTVLGALPAVVHPSPADVAIIGLGSGDTAWAAGCRAETRSITVFEIIRTQMELLTRLSLREPVSELRSFLSDPRLQIVVADGRNALERSDARYDIIEADALWPDWAYSGNLNSVEFYAHCSDRLKDGGLMCAWTPSSRILASFRTVFPYVISAETFAIGSRQPIPIKREAWRHRLEDRDVVRYLKPRRVQDVQDWLDQFQAIYRRLDGHPMNHDLFPRDEFAAP